MRLALQLSAFDWPGGSAELGPRLREIARTADEAGFHGIWVMDHVLQIPMIGSAEDPMPEAYSTLAFLAGITRQVKLGALVTAATLRNPGLLIKEVTTIDVLSGGRAYLGLGTGYYEREQAALGIPFPPLKERFERLEEVLQIAHQMAGDNNGPFAGRHYQLAETINSPASVSRPHPPILVGGGGEQKTLRLVARYADACNLIGEPTEVERKLAILRDHCAAVGRDEKTIEKTLLIPYLDPGPSGASAQQIVDQIGFYGAVGIQTVIAGLTGVESIRPLDILGRDVIPQIASF